VKWPMPEEEEGMYTCTECGEDFDSLTDDNECPHCGQEYVFPPVEEDDIEVLTPDSSSETHDTVEEAINAEGGTIGEESKDEEKTQDDLGDVIVPSDEIEDDSPECEHCGEPMDEAPEHIDVDWLCHNDGCEGSFTKEELEGEDIDEESVSDDMEDEQGENEEKSGKGEEESSEEKEEDDTEKEGQEEEEKEQTNLIYGPDGMNEDFEKNAG